MTERRLLIGAAVVTVVGEGGLIAGTLWKPIVGFPVFIAASIVGLIGFWKALDDTFHGRDL